VRVGLLIPGAYLLQAGRQLVSRSSASSVPKEGRKRKKEGKKDKERD